MSTTQAIGHSTTHDWSGQRTNKRVPKGVVIGLGIVTAAAVAVVGVNAIQDDGSSTNSASGSATAAQTASSYQLVQESIDDALRLHQAEQLSAEVGPNIGLPIVWQSTGAPAVTSSYQLVQDSISDALSAQQATSAESARLSSQAQAYEPAGTAQAAEATTSYQLVQESIADALEQTAAVPAAEATTSYQLVQESIAEALEQTAGVPALSVEHQALDTVRAGQTATSLYAACMLSAGGSADSMERAVDNCRAQVRGESGSTPSIPGGGPLNGVR